jgi:cytochrome c oxidase subunit IV
MSLKAGLPAGIVAAIGFDLMYITNTTITLAGQLAGAILLPGFFILIFVILYGTGESLMRNLGQNRLLSFEAAQHGRWWFQPVGESLWRGAALGVILFGGITLILNRVGPLVQAYFDLQTEEEALIYYTAIIPPLSVLGQNIGHVLFAEVAYRLFLVSMLSRFFRHAWLVAGIVGLVSAMWPLPVFEVTPYSFGLAINFCWDSS